MSIMTLPYTNLHEINLDWIIEQVKQAKEIADNVYSPENPPPYPVRTVNGQTGDVTIVIPVNSVNGKTGSVVTPFINPQDAIQRIDTQSPNEEAGIQRVLNNSGIVTLRVTHRGDTPEAYVRYSIPNGQNQEYRLLTLSDIPSSSGVVSVNGMTGVVSINGANLVISDSDNRTIAFAIDAAEDQLADQLDRILVNEDDINAIERGIAILATNNTHAAVTTGQFVFVKTHPTLTPGVYVATANIATNEALTSSNLSTIPNGGLNALKTNIDTLNSKLTIRQSQISDPPSGVTVDAIYYNDYFAFITYTSASRVWAENDSLGTIPSGMRPPAIIRTTGNTYASNIGVQIKIDTNGSVTYDSKDSVDGRISFTVMYAIS